MLHTERGTRGSQRAFVRYHDLLKDWTVPLFELGEQFDLRSVKEATANDIRLVHEFVDPTLRRVSLTWDDIDVPKTLREIAEESWENLSRLADPGGDDVKAHKALDELRVAYADYYGDAEAITQSSVVAARREGAQERRPAAPHAWRRRLGCPAARRPRAARCPGEDPAEGASRRTPRARALTGPSMSKVPAKFDLLNVEGDLDFGINWPWRHERLAAGTTVVLRVKNEARSLPFVLPGLLRATQAVVLVDNESDDGTPDVARRVADELGMSDRLLVTSYPFRVSRCGPEHLYTDPDSVHSLTYFYNWSFTHVHTSYSMKWDGDMVLTEDGQALLGDLSWQLPGKDVVLYVPRHSLYIASDSLAYLDLGLHNAEPFGYPMGEDYKHVKAFEWELRVYPNHARGVRLPEGSSIELKWLDSDEFAHWTAPGRVRHQLPHLAQASRVRAVHRPAAGQLAGPRGPAPDRGAGRVAHRRPRDEGVAAAGAASTGEAQRRREGSGGMRPDIVNIEGLPEYDVTWPWQLGPLAPGLTSVLRVKNEARNLPWVLPPMFEAVEHVVLVDNQSDDGTPEVALEVARRGRGGGAVHAGVVPLRRLSVRPRAPLHRGRLGAQPHPLLQLVVRPRADRAVDEVGRGHGADP